MELVLLLLVFSILFSGCAAVSVNGVEVNPEEPETPEEGMDPEDKTAFVVLGVLVGIGLIATR